MSKDTKAYLHSEKLGSEQWVGAGKTIWLVMDEEKAPVGANGVVHQTTLGPFKKARCRVWSLCNKYGWLPTR